MIFNPPVQFGPVDVTSADLINHVLHTVVHLDIPPTEVHRPENKRKLDFYLFHTARYLTSQDFIPRAREWACKSMMAPGRTPSQ